MYEERSTKNKDQISTFSERQSTTNEDWNINKGLTRRVLFIVGIMSDVNIMRFPHNDIQPKYNCRIMYDQIVMRDDPTLYDCHYKPPLIQMSCQTGTDPFWGSWFEIAEKIGFLTWVFWGTVQNNPPRIHLWRIFDFQNPQTPKACLYLSLISYSGSNSPEKYVNFGETSGPWILFILEILFS